MPGAPAKFPGGFVPAGPLPMAAPAYGAVPILSHMPYAARPLSQMVSIILVVILFHIPLTIRTTVSIVV